MAKHGVGFMQLLDTPGYFPDVDLQITGQLFLFDTIVRDEFMKRWVDQANGDRKTVHGFEDADEVASLEREQLVQCLDAGVFFVGQNHFLDGELPLMASFWLFEVREEHMLGAAEADAFRAKLDGFTGILRRVYVGADPEMARLIGPVHQGFVGLREFGSNERHRLDVDDAFASVQGDPIPFLDHFACSGHGLRFVIDVQFFRPDNAAFAPAARHNGCVAGLSAGGGEDALRDGHAADIFRAGFAADEDHLLAARGPLFCFLRGENHLANGGAGHGIDTGGQDFRGERFLVHFRIDHGIEEALDVFGLDTEQGLFLRDELFIRHVHGDAEGCSGSAFAGARLEHVEGAVLDGELHVLHVARVFLKFYSNFLELGVNLRHSLCHFTERHWRTDAGDDIFALGVDEVIAVKDFFAGTRVAREADAGAGIISGIAEHHLHDVDGRAEKAGDFFHASVGDGLFRHPGTKDGADGSPKLIHGIVREVRAGLLLEEGLVFGD